MRRLASIAALTTAAALIWLSLRGTGGGPKPAQRDTHPDRSVEASPATSEPLTEGTNVLEGRTEPPSVPLEQAPAPPPIEAGLVVEFERSEWARGVDLRLEIDCHDFADGSGVGRAYFDIRSSVDQILIPSASGALADILGQRAPGATALTLAAVGEDDSKYSEPVLLVTPLPRRVRLTLRAPGSLQLVSTLDQEQEIILHPPSVQSSDERSSLFRLGPMDSTHVGGLLPGVYRVTFGPKNAESATRFVVKQGQETTVRVPPVSKPVRLHGQVAASWEADFTGTMVQVTRAGIGRKWSQPTLVEAGGEFTMELPESGRYSIHAMGPPQLGHFLIRAEIVVPDGESDHVATIRVPGGAATIVVMDPDGTPSANSQVELRTVTPTAASSIEENSLALPPFAITDADGQVRLSSLEAGFYNVLVSTAATSTPALAGTIDVPKDGEVKARMTLGEVDVARFNVLVDGRVVEPSSLERSPDLSAHRRDTTERTVRRLECWFRRSDDPSSIGAWSYCSFTQSGDQRSLATMLPYSVQCDLFVVALIDGRPYWGYSPTVSCTTPGQKAHEVALQPGWGAVLRVNPVAADTPPTSLLFRSASMGVLPPFSSSSGGRRVHRLPAIPDLELEVTLTTSENAETRTLRAPAPFGASN